MSTVNPLLAGFKAATKPRERIKSWQWCEKHVVIDPTSALGGGLKWRADSAPWTKEVMEVFADNRIRRIAIRCSTQSSKTQTILNLVCWVVSEDPGPALWVGANRDEIRKFVNDRVRPTLEECRPVSKLLLHQGPEHFEFSPMTLYFTGSGSRGNLKSKPIRYLFLDEVAEYPTGHLEAALLRTRTYWNRKEVLISTADLADDAMDREYKKGDQRTPHWCCPQCQQLTIVKQDHLRWDENETTKPDGKWDFNRVAETIRWECPKCQRIVRDTPYDRREFAKACQYVRMNPNAPADVVSFTWPALLVPWVQWRELVERFINAREAAKRGDLEPLKSVVNDDFGEPWHDELGVIDDWTFLEDRKADYDFGAPWSEEVTRFMSADKQASGGEHYFYVIRAFGRFGNSRLIAYGRASNKLELEELRKQYNVPVRNSMIDSGYRANEVYRFCAGTGWKPFKGDSVPFYLYRDPATEKTVRRVWDWTWARPEGERVIGRRINVRLFRFSNDWTKDLLAEFMSGLVGEWTIPKGIGRDYLSQVTAEVREEIQDTRGAITFRWVQKRKENHYLDCELQIMVAAVITKLVSAGRQGGREKLKAAA